jgi:hypothetical protein
MVGPDELSALQWDTIVSIIQAQMNVGPTGAGSGTNPTGKLQTLQYVSKSIDLSSNTLPACGVQLHTTHFENFASQQLMAHSTFFILLATSAKTNPTTGLAILDDAMMQLRTLIADGQGNGIGPILRSRANFNLNGYALRTLLSDWQLAWDLPEQTDQEPRAFATATYSAWQQVATFT